MAWCMNVLTNNFHNDGIFCHQFSHRNLAGVVHSTMRCFQCGKLKLTWDGSRVDDYCAVIVCLCPVVRWSHQPLVMYTIFIMCTDRGRALERVSLTSRR